MNPTRILVVGGAVMDFVFKLDAMPREARKYHSGDAQVIGGGCAANAAVAIARLGGEAHLATALGTDPLGDMILGDLAGEHVDVALAQRLAGRRSSFSSVLVDASGDRQIVGFRDADLHFDPDRFRAEAPSGVGALLADTRFPEASEAAMLLARERGIPGIIDGEIPLKHATSALELASHVAFSVQGLNDLTDEADLLAGLRKASSALPGWVCVTDGGNGVYYLRDGEIAHVPAVRVEAVDTLGAGDVWHGAFALRLAEGASEEQAIGFANAVAALKCTRFGGRKGTPGRSEAEAMQAENAR